MTVEQLPPWVDHPAVSDRVNNLLHQDESIINEIGRLLDAGQFDDATVQDMQDLWGESLDIEDKLTKARAPELDWRPRT